MLAVCPGARRLRILVGTGAPAEASGRDSKSRHRDPGEIQSDATAAAMPAKPPPTTITRLVDMRIVEGY